MKKIIIWLLAIGLIAGLSIYLYLFHFGAKHDDPLKSSSMVSVTAIELYDIYNSNEDSANKLYLGKVIKVTGTIASIDVKENRYTINLVSNGDMGTVMCEMDINENPKLKDLKQGMPVVIAGFCNGINLDVYLDRCKLAE